MPESAIDTERPVRELGARMSGPQVSVVVPTRDRPRQLEACLRALDAQTATSLEIVVVDDASVDATAVAAVVAEFRRARLVRAGGRGPAAARNVGTAAAKGNIICFTDDDCRPEPQWAAALTARVGDDAAAGATIVGDSNNRFAVASQTITNHLVAASHDPATSVVGFAPTCNLACRAHLARALPFDEGYPLAAGEDRAWCEQVGDRGHRIAFVDAARVRHHPDLHWRSYWRQHIRYGRGAWRFHRERRDRRRLHPSRFYLDLLRSAFREGIDVGCLVIAAQAATAWGAASEALVSRRR
jgi:glycosyltransferase involved in cell wall biosynthesis